MLKILFALTPCISSCSLIRKVKYNFKELKYLRIVPGCLSFSKGCIASSHKTSLQTDRQLVLFSVGWIVTALYDDEHPVEFLIHCQETKNIASISLIVWSQTPLIDYFFQYQLPSESELYSDLLAGSYSEFSSSSLFSASAAGSFLLIFSSTWFSIGTWGSKLFRDTVTSSFTLRKTYICYVNVLPKCLLSVTLWKECKFLSRRKTDKPHPSTGHTHLR